MTGGNSLARRLRPVGGNGLTGTISRLRRRRLAAAIVSAGLATGVLAACSGSNGGAVAGRTSTAPHPVVAAAQAQGVLIAVGSSVDQAASASAGSALGPRIVGPMLQEASVLRRLPAGLRAGGPIGTQTWRRLIVPQQSSWPRWFLAVGAASAHPTPLLSVLYSASARAPYGLWGQLTLLPGQTVPEVAPVEAGAPALTGSAAGYLIAPGTVATQYADLLNRGTASPAGRLFTPDVFSQQVSHQLATDRAAFIRYGTVSARQAAAAGAVLALRTQDGGALVIAELTQTYLVTVRPDAGTVKVDPALAALAGKSRFAHQVTRTSQEIVAFVVPAQGSSQRIRVVAAAKADLAATGS